MADAVKILKIMEANARLSLEDVAAMTDATPAEVAAALDEAENAGIIRGYRTVIDWDKTDSNRVRALIELKVTPKKDHGFDEIAETIAMFPEVDTVTLMSGGFDLGLILTGKSFQEIAMFVAKRLSPLDNVLSTATHFVLRTYKRDGISYMDEAVDERRGDIL